MIHARCFAALLTAAGAGAADLPRDAARYDFSALPAAMAAEIASGTPAGFTLMLVKDSEVVFEGAVGTETLASVVPIASASKMPSTTLIMSLVEQGLIGLDDRIADRLAFWPQSASDPKSQITVRQCLANTSGLPTTATYIEDFTLTLDQAVQGIATLPLNFSPGTQSGYNGNGFQVAACVAEHVSGKTWAQLVQERYTTPLGLTTFTYGPSGNPRVAGGISSNTGDYARILALHLARGRYLGRRLLAAGTVDRMQEDEWVNQGISVVFNSPMPSDDYHYGLSWWLSPYTTTVAEVSDAGAFGTVPWIDLGRGYAGVILMQNQAYVGLRVWNDLTPTIIGAIDARHDLIVVRPAAAIQSATATTLTALGGAWGPESAIAYTWSAVSGPSGAPAPVFVGNGSNDAQECALSGAVAGTWIFRVTITAPSAPGLSVTSEVTVAIPADPGSRTTAGSTTSGTGATGGGSTSGDGGGSSGSGCGLGGGLTALLLIALSSLRPRRTR